MVIAKNKYGVSVPPIAIRLSLVSIFDIAALWLIIQLVQDGSYPLAAVVGVLIVVITASFSVERLRAYRWLSIGLSLTILFVLYPIVYTFYLSTTNTGHGHVLTKQQAINSLERTQFVQRADSSSNGRRSGQTAGIMRCGCEETTGQLIWHRLANHLSQPAQKPAA